MYNLSICSITNSAREQFLETGTGASDDQNLQLYYKVSERHNYRVSFNLELAYDCIL